MQTYYDYIKLFYKDISATTFKGISAKKILELKYISKNFNKYFNSKNVDDEKYKKYKNIIKLIKTNVKKFNIKSEAEKFILLMFCVDPTFETFKIYGECNRTDEIHQKMLEQFGIHDHYLIYIEKTYIKYFLSKRKQDEINEEIEKRIYK